MKIKFKKGDIIVIISVIILIIIVSVLTFPKSSGKEVEISIDGKSHFYPLNKDTTIETDGEFKNIVTIRNDEVWISNANCPDKLCKNTGKISKKGQSIICVPEKMIIRITGGGEVDAITN